MQAIVVRYCSCETVLAVLVLNVFGELFEVIDVCYTADVML